MKVHCYPAISVDSMKDAEVVDSDYYEKGTIVQRVGKALVCLGGDAGTTVE